MYKTINEKKRLAINCVLMAAILIFVSGCGINSPFETCYRDVKATQAPHLQNVMSLPSTPPKLIQVDNMNANVQEWVKRGYCILGYSDFSSGSLNPYLKKVMMTRLAKKVGAEVVLFSIYSAGSKPGILAMPSYNVGANYTANSIGSISGPSGMYAGSYSQNTVVTSPGTFSTQYVPTFIQQFDYIAFFLALKKPEYLTPQQRALAQ
jgi:hypothetical protein